MCPYPKVIIAGGLENLLFDVAHALNPLCGKCDKSEWALPEST